MPPASVHAAGVHVPVNFRVRYGVDRPENTGRRIGGNQILSRALVVVPIKIGLRIVCPRLVPLAVGYALAGAGRSENDQQSDRDETAE